MSKKESEKNVKTKAVVKKTTKVKDSYFKQVKDEMKKVKWPDKKEMTKYSIATIVFILIFALYFFGLDALFAWFKELVS